MASKTPNLGLILPGNGEYYNTWDQPNNGNFTIIDTILGAVQAEVVNARGSAQTLVARLNNTSNADGTPLPSAEIVAARVSSIYGGFETGGAANDLNARIENPEMEIFTARQSLPSLVQSLAWGPDQNKHNSIISAATNFLTYTGAVVSLNGSVTPVVANINGYRQVARTIKTVTISGAAATYYLTLTYSATGTTYLNQTVTNGSTNVYNGNALIAKFSDSSQNFVSLGVQPGDVLQINGPTGNINIGTYVVLATSTQDSTNLTTSDLAILGQFPSSTSGLTYTLTNPVDPQLGFTGTAHAKRFARVNNVIFIGRCVFDGTNISSLTTYQPQGVYNGFTSVSLTGGNFAATIAHNLGYYPSKITFYGSQASDFSQPLDLLSPGNISSGGGALQQSIMAQTTDLTVAVKNPTNGLFYADINGTSYTSGYLYVVAER